MGLQSKPVSPNDEGIAPLDFASLVIVGIEKVTSDPSAVAFFILPVGEGMVEAIGDQVEIAHDLLENLEDEFTIMEKQASASTELLDGPGSETVTDETGSGPPSGGPPSGGPPSGGPPSGGPPSGGPLAVWWSSVWWSSVWWSSVWWSSVWWSSVWWSSIRSSSRPIR